MPSVVDIYLVMSAITWARTSVLYNPDMHIIFCCKVKPSSLEQESKVEALIILKWAQEGWASDISSQTHLQNSCIDLWQNVYVINRIHCKNFKQCPTCAINLAKLQTWRLTHAYLFTTKFKCWKEIKLKQQLCSVFPVLWMLIVD